MSNINIPIKCPKCGFCQALNISIKNPEIKKLEAELGLVDECGDGIEILNAKKEPELSKEDYYLYSVVTGTGEVLGVVKIPKEVGG